MLQSMRDKSKKSEFTNELPHVMKYSGLYIKDHRDLIDQGFAGMKYVTFVGFVHPSTDAKTNQVGAALIDPFFTLNESKDPYIHNYVFITPYGVNPPATKKFPESASSILYPNNMKEERTVQSFTYEEMFFHPLSHVMVPNQRVLSIKDSRYIMTPKGSKQTSERSNMPVVYSSDRIVKHLDGRPGQVLESITKSKPYMTYINKEVKYQLIKPPDPNRK
jgi:DNA-directed RNA polymerase subunit H (RpoH/RPB5)